MNVMSGPLRQSPYAPFAMTPTLNVLKGMIFMIKTCPICNKQFEGRQQKYCSFACRWTAKQIKSKRTPRGHKGTLCWNCKNACGGCSWSRSFTPVEGWNARETTLKSADGNIQSFFVTDCPEFING